MECTRLAQGVSLAQLLVRLPSQAREFSIHPKVAGFNLLRS